MNEELDFEEMTLEELDDERRNLLEEINNIQTQLTNRKVEIDEKALATGLRDPHGRPRANRRDWLDYTKWRASATAALRHKQVQMADLKAEMRKRRQAGSSEDPTEMLSDLLQIIERTGVSGMSSEDLKTVNRVSVYLNGMNLG